MFKKPGVMDDFLTRLNNRHANAEYIINTSYNDAWKQLAASLGFPTMFINIAKENGQTISSTDLDERTHAEIIRLLTVLAG